MRIPSLAKVAFSVLSFVGSATLAEAGIVIAVDKAAQQMLVEVDGVPQYVWPVSTGAPGYETPGGSFKPFRMELDHYSREWDDAPMPHSIFFTEQGHAIHGSYQTRQLGRAVSHGCIRLAPQNAAHLFALVKAHGVANTQIVIGGVGSGIVLGEPGEGPPIVQLGPEWQEYYDPMPIAPLEQPRGYMKIW
jgi:hypothetical protein